MEKQTVSALELAEFCVKTADERKAENIVKLNVGDVTFIADYFVICSGGSTVQIAAIQSNIERSVRESFQLRPLSVEGDSISGWVLIDFGLVIVHIMTSEKRDRYQIEKLWGDAAARQELDQVRPTED